MTDMNGLYTDADASPISFSKVVRSEWIKQRTLRSTWITVAIVLVVLIGFGLLAAAMSSGAVSAPSNGGGPGGPAGPSNSSDPVGTVLTGANLAVLVFGVMGALMGAREYSSGLIRTTLAAVPKRMPVLLAKTLSLSFIVVPVAIGGVLVAYFGGSAILDINDKATLAFGDGGVARAVLGTGGYLAGISLIGLALGMILRSSASAIGVLLGGVLILPGIAGALLPDSWDGALKFLPSKAAEAFTSVAHTSSTLEPMMGAIVFVAWVVAAECVAGYLLMRRDS